MYDRDNDGHYVRFDTWGEFLTYATRPANATWAKFWEDDYVHTDRDVKFFGTHTFAEALKLAEAGWSEGETQVKELSERMSARLLQGIVREDWRYDVEGSTFDVARYVEGEPEHWIAPDETYERGVKTVRVVVNMAISAGVPAARFTQRGIAAAALVEALAYAGTRVELIGVTAWQSGSTHAEQAVMLKAADQPIDPARLAFAMAHPAMVRRLLFAAQMQAATHMPNLGQPTEATDWTTGALLRNDDGTIYLKQLHLKDDTFATEASTERWILDTLATHGVSVRGLNAD